MGNSFRATPARLGRAAVASAVAVLAGPLARGGTSVWQGQSVDANWTRPSNWVGGVAPANDGTADLLFNGVNTALGSDLAPNLDASYAVDGMTFQGSSGFHLTTTGGSALTLGAGGLQQQSPAAQAVDPAMTLGVDQTWALAGPLTAGGGVALNGHALTLTSTAAPAVSGAITGAGSLTKTGTGTLALTGPSSFGAFSGGSPVAALNVRGGTLAIAGPAAVVTANSFASIGIAPGDAAGVTLSGGARFGFGAYYAYTSSAYTSGSDFAVGDHAASLSANVAATLAVQDAGTLLDAGYLYVGKGSLNGNGVTAGTVNQTGGTVAARSLFFVGSYASGTYNLSGGTLSSGQGTGGIALPDGLAAASVVGARAGGTGVLNESGGTVSVAGDLYVGENGTGTVTQTGGAAAVGGTLVLAGATGAVGAYDLSAGSGSVTATGPLVVGRQGAGTLKVGPGASVGASGLVIDQLPKTAVTSRVAQTGGTVTLGAGGLASGTFSGTNGFRSSAVYVLGGGTLLTPSISQPLSAGVALTFDFNGGTLQPTAPTAALFQAVAIANVQAGGAVIDTSGFAVTVGQNLLHDATVTGPDGGLAKRGAGTLTLAGSNTYTGPTTVTAGTLAFAASTGPSVAVRSLPGGLTVAAGATAALALAATSAARSLLVTGGLTLAGTFDLSNNDLSVANGDVAALTARAAAGFAGGAWTGAGLTSSTAAADGHHLTAVGVVPNATGTGTLYATFDGQPASATDVLARYTEYGDANLDGAVTAADFVRLDAGYVGHLTGWLNGDFNYDGGVDGSDYALADNAFNQQAGGLAAPAAVVAVAAVPEPAAVGLLAMGTLLLGRRRALAGAR